MKQYYSILILMLSWILAFGCAQEASAQGGLSIPSLSFTQSFLSSSRSTTSPYLALAFNRQTGQNFGNPGVYQNRVRPRLDALRKERAQSQRIGSIQNQINQLNRPLTRSSTARRGPSDSQQALVPTGHPTGFMTYLHYYPAAGR